jgi:hypothetical protein
VPAQEGDQAAKVVAAGFDTQMATGRAEDSVQFLDVRLRAPGPRIADADVEVSSIQRWPLSASANSIRPQSGRWASRGSKSENATTS